MTEQDALGGVISERHIAAIAHGDKAALATEDTTGGTAPVEIEDGLLSPAQNLFKFALQTAADDAGIACMEFIAQVDDLNRGERGSDAIAQLNQLIRVTISVIKRLDRWRRAAQHDRDVEHTAKCDGGCARVIGWPVLTLLVGRFMLLVQDQDA